MGVCVCVSGGLLCRVVQRKATERERETKREYGYI